MLEMSPPKLELEDCAEVLEQMDALFARQREPQPQVPILTSVVGQASEDDIPVLTDVVPMFGEELIFCPDEIAYEEALDELNNFDLDALGPLPEEPQALAQTMLAEELLAEPVMDQFAPLNFPELALPELELAVSSANDRVATFEAAPSLAPSMMPELSFAFAAPLNASAEPVFEPEAVLVAMPATKSTADVPIFFWQDELLPELSIELPSDFDFESSPVVQAQLEEPTSLAPAMDAAVLAEPLNSPEPECQEPECINTLPQLDEEALTQQIQAALRPELEKLVRGELTRQIASLHTEAVRRALGALQPQLDKLIASHLEARRC